SFLIAWADYDGGNTPTDHLIAPKVHLTQLLVHFSFTGVLAIVTASDIKRFRREAKSPVSVNWKMIFVFWTFLIVSQVGTWMALDYRARNFGECRFPRLQDVIYQKEFEKRTELATLILGRKDFSCGWVWDIETAESHGEHEYQLLLVGYWPRDNDTLFWVSERIYLYEEFTADEFLEKAKPRYNYSGAKYIVNVDDPNAIYSHVECFRSRETDCNLTFGYQRIVSKIELTFSGLSDEQINELIQQIVSTNSARIHEYETGLQ
ncbi:MAG: hypothetical protein AB1750_17660, partial [Chloroflexota bacterium]